MSQLLYSKKLFRNAVELFGSKGFAYKDLIIPVSKSFGAKSYGENTYVIKLGDILSSDEITELENFADEAINLYNSRNPSKTYRKELAVKDWLLELTAYVNDARDCFEPDRLYVGITEYIACGMHCDNIFLRDFVDSIADNQLCETTSELKEIVRKYLGSLAEHIKGYVDVRTYYPVVISQIPDSALETFIRKFATYY